LAAREHVPPEGLAAQIGALEIEGDDGVELFFRELFGGTAEGGAGTVDEDIDRTAIALERCGEGRTLLPLGDVELCGGWAAALSANGLGGRLRTRDIDIGGDDMDADLAEADCDRGTKSARTAGYDGDTSAEIEKLGRIARRHGQIVIRHRLPRKNPVGIIM